MYNPISKSMMKALVTISGLGRGMSGNLFFRKSTLKALVVRGLITETPATVPNAFAKHHITEQGTKALKNLHYYEEPMS